VQPVTRAEWPLPHTSHSDDWPVEGLLEAKRAAGWTVSVVIPARNEAETVAGVVAALRGQLVDRAGLVDELVVIDSDSTDATAARAREAGATVHAARDILPELGALPGKGEALWKSLFVTTGEILVFIDADLTEWGIHFVTGLLGPMLNLPHAQLVKGFYDRVSTYQGQAAGLEGGRVTELLARPLLNLWWPELGGLVQPLAGEWAVRRSLFESMEVPAGYGVELATVLEAHARHGLAGLAQVDLGARAHSHQSIHDLSLMAAELLAVADRRRNRTAPENTPPHPLPSQPLTSHLVQFRRDPGGTVRPVCREVPAAVRPKATGLEAYRSKEFHR